MAVDSSYVLPPGATPESLKRRRAVAAALMKQGMDASPIASPWQGVARVAQAGIGGLLDGMADREERDARAASQSRMSAIVQALAGGGSADATAAPSVNGAPAGGSGAGSPVGGFTNAVNRTLGFEGGLNPADTNGTPSNFGINQKANPDVDVKNLNRDTATALYKSRYWDTIGGDQLAAQNPALAHVAFDTSVIAGPGKAKELLAQAGGDPMKFLQLRETFQNALLSRDPGKYGPYAKAWGDRMAGLRADVGYTGSQPSPVAAALAGGNVGTGAPVRTAMNGTTASDAPAPGLLAFAPSSTTPSMTMPNLTGRTDAPGETPTPAQQPPQASGAATGAPPSFAGGGQTMSLPSAASVPPEKIVQAASSPQVQQAAQQAAGTQRGQQIISQSKAAPIAALMAAMSDPWMSEGEKSLLIMLAKDRLAGDDVKTVDLGDRIGVLDKQGNEVRSIPKARAPVAVGPDQRLVDPMTGKEIVGPTDTANTTEAKNYARDMADRKARGMPEVPYGEWLTAYRKSGANNMTIDQRAEGAFEQTVAKNQGEMFGDLAKDGVQARTDLGQIQQLRRQLVKLPGGFVGGMQSLANSYGIKLGPNVGAVEAADSILNRLTPAQRQGLPGAASDRDVAMFRAALPKLNNTPGGNEVILNTMEALAMQRRLQAEIANKVITGRMSRSEGMDALMALPDPFEAFKSAGGEKLVDPSAMPTAPGGKSYESLWR